MQLNDATLQHRISKQKIDAGFHVIISNSSYHRLLCASFLLMVVSVVFGVIMLTKHDLFALLFLPTIVSGLMSIFFGVHGFIEVHKYKVQKAKIKLMDELITG